MFFRWMVYTCCHKYRLKSTDHLFKKREEVIIALLTYKREKCVLKIIIHESVMITNFNILYIVFIYLFYYYFFNRKTAVQ